mmetsp:Transcript_2820/g.6077  ORF Transcript_2820/g.6077 Transcript_2820/m.6077 type:complete len:100 (+) Transcript_2820:166-465(+)
MWADKGTKKLSSIYSIAFHCSTASQQIQLRSINGHFVSLFSFLIARLDEILGQMFSEVSSIFTVLTSRVLFRSSSRSALFFPSRFPLCNHTEFSVRSFP